MEHIDGSAGGLFPDTTYPYVNRLIFLYSLLLEV